MDNSSPWISSDQLPKIGKQQLPPEQVDGFLEYLFSSVAQRPKPLRLRQGAQVVRYLKELAWEARPSPIGQTLNRLADVIWMTLLQYAPFSMSGKKAAIEFLGEHARTHLSTFDLEPILAYVNAANPPRGQTKGLSPPALMSKAMAVTGHNVPQRSDDLSERIYAAYCALRRARIHSARRRIAAALNRAGLRSRAHAGTISEWGSGEVIERVKQFEKRWKEHRGKAAGALDKYREQTSDKWLHRFHSSHAGVA